MDLFQVKSDVFKTNYNHWRVLLKKKNDLHNIVEILGRGEEPIVETPIVMTLINGQSPEFLKNGDSFDLDFFRWADDLLYEAFTPFVGGGAYYIVSDRLLGILKKFKLPEYFVKKVILQNSLNGKVKEYNLLFIKGNFNDKMDYYKSIFKLETIGYPKEIVRKLSNGEIISKDDLKLKQMRMYKEKKLLLRYDEIVLKEDYDILWGLPNILYVNQNVKRIIEESNIKGVGIYPMKDLNFITPLKYQNR